jgi:hypothetical protein
MKRKLLIMSLVVLTLASCSNLYYGAMEKMGKPKRDIMVDRVEAARDTQNDAKEQFLTTLEQFKEVVHFEGGDLEKEYNKLNSTLEKTETEAAKVHKRILAIEDVSQALFSEWAAEINLYSSDVLRRASQKKLDETQLKYTELIAAMLRAEARLEPALAPLRDQVLFMKHNLNASAIAGLSTEVVSVQTNVDRLVQDLENAINKADDFIKALQEQ